MNKEELIQEIADAAFEESVDEIFAMEVGDLTIVAEEFLLITGRNINHNRSIADAIIERLNEKGEAVLHNDGYEDGGWIVLDYSNIIVHIYRCEERDYYKLDKLWGDAPYRILKSNGEIVFPEKEI